MKKHFSLILLITIVSIKSYSQKIENILGTWEGSYHEFNGKDTVFADCIMQLNRVDNGYVFGNVKYYNFTNNKAPVVSNIKVFYDYISDHDQFIYDAKAPLKNSTKTTKGTMGYKVSFAKSGQTYMVGNFRSNNENEDSNDILTILVFKDNKPITSLISKTSAPNNIFVVNSHIPPALVTSIADNIIYLDATELDNFHEGFAIIRKGENFAIIDKLGKFLIPYGKYNFTGIRGRIDTRTCGFKNGMCAVQDPNTEKYGFISLKGNLIVPCSFTYVQPFTEDGYAWLEEGDEYNKKYFFVDKSGKKFAVAKNQKLSNPSILKIYNFNIGGKLTEFYDKTGKLIMRTSRKVIGDYSDGLIKVDSSFQAAGDKIGFIDIHNKLVIPYKFKGRVMDFHDGLAYYEPTIRDEYMYAYMDKTGNPVIKMQVTDNIKRATAFGHEDFQSGYAHCEINGEQHNPKFLDKQGNIIPLINNIEQKNTFFTSQFKTFKAEFSIYDDPRQEDMIRITGLMAFTMPEKRVAGGFGGGSTFTKDVQIDFKGVGIAQISGKLILPPIFSKIGFPDPISGLTMATITKDMNGNYYNGYVDNTGKFTILTTYKP